MAEKKKHFILDDKIYFNPIKKFKEKDTSIWEIGNLRIMTKGNTNRLRKLIYEEFMFKVKTMQKRKKLKS